MQSVTMQDGPAKALIVKVLHYLLFVLKLTAAEVLVVLCQPRYLYLFA